ncbi:Phosphotransferase enzyme family protein [Calidithermus terrae]|uniref:Phosphotransferase enzyme family protein n=1 Tax=Calidithermus terrae TaxID=1408545 RepID=A0A399F2M3_9DEIN|nr:aminoglycoside phosphotransferase family protein [Calidithermus terrae]RIH89529.1 Phosphotransferase enzyme family protein [Calidithermus terrae]
MSGPRSPDPAELLRRHGLCPAGEACALTPARHGLVNRVFLGERYVVRIAKNPLADHAREARLALAALKRGVRTARPLAWGQGYSIWERLPGHSLKEVGKARPELWDELLADLEKIHAGPLEPGPTPPRLWKSGDSSHAEATRAEAGWSAEELEFFRAALETPHPVRPAYVHGDAFGENIVADEGGGYVGLIDWGCAGWQSLEYECSRLEEEALELALKRWPDLDLELLWKARLDLFLLLARYGRLPFAEVRRMMQQVREVRS